MNKLIASARESVRTRRTAKQERVALERELASFSSPSDLRDLEAILARHPDNDTRAIRDVLRLGSAQRRPPTTSR